MRQYRALAIISLLLRIFGYVLVVTGFLFVIIWAVLGFWHGFLGEVLTGVSLGLEFTISGLFMLAFGEVMRVLMDIEANTRTSRPAPAPPRQP
jgi:hypothetical protein